MSPSQGKKIIKLMEVDSTNNYAKANYAKEQWPEMTVVQASYQSRGRGQVSNFWESEAGKNLLCSVVFYPEFLPVQGQFLLSEVVSLAVARCVSNYVSNVSIKWPNDIYVGSSKVAGILIENAIMGNAIGNSVVGIGLNINQQKFLSNAPNPVSIFQLLGIELDVDLVLEGLIEEIEKGYELLKQGGVDLIVEEYHSMLYRLGEMANYQDDQGIFEGTIEGVSPQGVLSIRRNSGQLKEYLFKEVAFV
jgi:BirA family transcriptional regulator, biotin operon repressor / biotin---[acetyl-CoA-carboxylase] ligase